MTRPSDAARLRATRNSRSKPGTCFSSEIGMITSKATTRARAAMVAFSTLASCGVHMALGRSLKAGCRNVSSSMAMMATGDDWTSWRTPKIASRIQNRVSRERPSSRSTCGTVSQPTAISVASAVTRRSRARIPLEVQEPADDRAAARRCLGIDTEDDGMADRLGPVEAARRQAAWRQDVADGGEIQIAALDPDLDARFGGIQPLDPQQRVRRADADDRLGVEQHQFRRRQRPFAGRGDRGIDLAQDHDAAGLAGVGIELQAAAVAFHLLAGDLAAVDAALIGADLHRAADDPLLRAGAEIAEGHGLPGPQLDETADFDEIHELQPGARRFDLFDDRHGFAGDGLARRHRRRQQSGGCDNAMRPQIAATQRSGRLCLHNQPHSPFAARVPGFRSPLPHAVHCRTVYAKWARAAKAHGGFLRFSPAGCDRTHKVRG